MSLCVITTEFRPESYARALRAAGFAEDIVLWPDVPDMGAVTYALAWKPPPGALAKFPNLKVVFSVGAGVDHLLTDPDLPDVPVVRFADPDLSTRMSDYAVLHALLHTRRFTDYRPQQAQAEWRMWPEPRSGEVRVGVMGLGAIGQDVAQALAAQRFQVAGWSRSPKQVPGVESFAGDEGLNAFLARTDILVALLPATAATKGILNADLFGKLARDGALPGPVLINAGRGALQVEADILSCLADGTLWAASLDVFEHEPLPSDHPLWRHPRVVVTPHTAAVSSADALARFVIAQVADFEAGRDIGPLVDRSLGY